MRKIVDWLLFTYIFTACCAVGLCMTTESLINGIAPALLSPLHVFLFGSTLVIYNTHMAARKILALTKKNKSLSRNWFRHTLFSLIGFLLLGISACNMPTMVLAACAVPAVISFAYSLPLLPFGSRKTLRELGSLKIFALSFVWTFSTAGLPMLFWQKSIAAFPFELLLRFALMFSLCLIFDIRDIRADAAVNIRTLPRVIGRLNSYRLLAACSALFVLLSSLQYTKFHSLHRIFAAFITAIAIIAVARYLRKHNSEQAHLLIGDGVMMLYCLLVLL